MCGGRVSSHCKLGRVLECPRAANPQTWLVVTDETGATVAVVVHRDMLGRALRLFEAALADELGFVAP